MATYDYSTNELGRILGTSIKSASNYKESFIPTENNPDLQLVHLNNVDVSGYYNVITKYASGSAFIIDHPIYGAIDYNPSVEILIPLQSNTSSIADYGNNSYNGVNMNGITFVASSTLTGSVAQFNRTNQYINFPTFPTITTPYSINVWLMTPSVYSQSQAVIDLTGPNIYPTFNLTNNGRYLMYCGSEQYMYTTTIVSSSMYNQWHMMTFIVGSSSVNDFHAYCNGVLCDGARGANNSTFEQPKTTNIQVGRQGTGSYWGGQMAELGIFGKILSQNEILTMYSGSPSKRYPNVGTYTYYIDGTFSSSTLVSSGMI